MPKHHDGKAIGLGALGLGTFVTGVAGTYKVSEALVHLRKLYDVGENNMVFVRITERVRIDLAECERLLDLKAVKYALSRSPEKVAWIKKTIGAMKVGLQQMAQHTVRVRKDVERGRWVGLWNRIYWLLEEKEKLEIHSIEVGRCHDGLLQVLGFLATLEPLACCEEAQQGRSYQQEVSHQQRGSYQPGQYYEREDTYQQGGAQASFGAQAAFGARGGGLHKESERFVQEEADVHYQEGGQRYDEEIVEEHPRYREFVEQGRYINREGDRRVEMDQRVEYERRPDERDHQDGRYVHISREYHTSGNDSHFDDDRVHGRGHSRL